MSKYFLAFVPIFVAVDALGMLPVFLSLTEGMEKGKKNTLIRHSTLTALLVALAFLFIGKFLFDCLGITISDFMVAGGAILFIISIRDLLTFSKSARMTEDLGVVPLAVPLMVGPAVLASSLILLNSFGASATIFSLVSNILLCGVILFFSDALARFLGATGSNTLSKISNLLLAAIGVMLMRRGIGDFLTAWIHYVK